jgi:uncharacterized protein YcbX
MHHGLIPMTPSSDQAHIAQLWIHPVKSCAAVAVQEAQLMPTGLQWDREWMVVDARGHFVTQRELPQLALIQPKWGHEAWVLKAPGMLPLHVQAWAYESETEVEIWGDEVPALDIGPLAAQWFTDFVAAMPAGQEWLRTNGPLRLVRTHPDHLRVSDSTWTGTDRAQVGFADGFGLLVTSEASLGEFNRRMIAAQREAVDMRRFRPNIVLSGMNPHGEDDVKALHWSDGTHSVTCHLTKPCPRCSIPEVNPDLGVREEGVTSVLSAYRGDQRLGGALTFGMNAHWHEPLPEACDSWPVLKVGDAVRLDFGF